MLAEDIKRIIQILLTQGIISSQQLEQALKEYETHGGFIGDILARLGVDEQNLFNTLSQHLGIAFLDLNTITIEPAVLELFPKNTCLKYTCIPLFVMRDTLTVAMSNPFDEEALKELQSSSNLKVKPVFATPTVIRNTIDTCFPDTPAKETLTDMQEEISSLKESSYSSVIEIVNEIITTAVEMKASDIHIEPRQDSFNYRYRIDGIMYEMKPLPLQHQAAVISRLKVMASLDIAEKRLPQDGRIQMGIRGKEVDLRVSTFPTIYGENLVIRILDRSSGALNLKELGFSEEVYKQFYQLIHRPYGVILVTGPTGSGKTTTLYAALQKINSLEKNIVTLEDPVEYELPLIRQSQVNPKAGLTFSTGLRSIVRQDPDIIMIGEIRDTETADIAIHAALTGHLVFSTLHTNDAPSSFTRLIDMGVEPFLIASSVIGVLAQRLVRTLCNSCKHAYEPSPELLERLGLHNLVDKKITFYKEVGCTQCKNRGYAGRTCIAELLITNEEIKELVTQKTQSIALRQEAIKSGMKTLRDAGLEKVLQGITSLSEILRVTEK